ncbi:MAG TPA: NAD(P)-dependent oxidoreductase [Candidatus Avidesulfovibrio excrementigallinarum]|nr:NAD(P)-dependent oxidoreductase [Candidatus Avidesulfovibrio excrementigallinarum]
MKILAIGAAGFLGSYIVREFLENGHEVTVLDFKKEAPNLPKGVNYAFGDVTDAQAMREVVGKEHPEVIVNLAGLLTGLCARNPYQAISVNSMGMANVLEAARLNGVQRVVISSSAGVCSPDRVDTREERWISPQISMYGATKFMCEVLAREFRKNYGLEVVCLRFSLIYGPGSVASVGNAMRIKTIERCVTGENIVIDDVRATDRVHLLHVADAAHAAVLAATAAKVPEPVYNISGIPADFLSFEEIVDILHTACPGAGTVTFTGTGAPVEYGVYLHDKARRDLGFVPAMRASVGLVQNAQCLLKSLQKKAE